ncbi:MAG: hypothetical protein ACJ78T_19050, partial [Myxococcales bacterium]
GGTDPVELAPGLLVIPVPGHTPGSAALLVDDTYLFTGDHLWAEGRSGVPLRRAEAEGRSIGGDRSIGGGSLGMSRSVCWYSWDEQISSLEKLLDFRFRFVLPGHGRRAVARDDREMREWIRKLLREVRYQ